MKIGAVIITYNPNINVLKSNIDAIESQIFELILVDNGSKNIVDITNEVNKVRIISNVENKGVATATNQAMEYFNSQKFDWVLTLDQDTIVPSTLISNFIKFIHVEDVGILAPVYIDRNSPEKRKQNTDNQLTEVSNPIASGALIKLSAWEAIDGFDDELFIDRVDDDFDLRLIKKGYRLFQVNSECISHEIGSIKTFKIGRINIKIFNHSPVRKYYISRNAIIFYKKHGNLQDTIKRLVILIFKVAFFENNKFLKMKSIVRGVRDGINYSLSNHK